jgi:hypothetical protein
VNNFDNSGDLGSQAGLPHLSARSISRRLNDAGLKSMIAAIKDILTDEHKAARLAFALRYVNFPIEFWRWVVFTDEKSWSSNAHGQIRVRRLPGKRFDKENIHQVKRSGRTSVCVWAGMWLGGLTPLVRVNGNLTARQYIDRMLNPVLLPFMAEINPPGEAHHFVQDRCYLVLF